MPISKRTVYIRDFEEDALKLLSTYGKTELFSTGVSGFDKYLGGGFGRPDGYEIVLLYGESGVGKSTVALNMIAPTINEGRRVGLLILEDDMPDVNNRLRQILQEENYTNALNNDNVICLPNDELMKSWSLTDLLKHVEFLFSEQKVELILLDHVQFAFENAESVKGENEYVAQRVFMQKLNQLMKRLKKTIILISHMNKTAGAKGMNQITGSKSLPQAATKVIEVVEGDAPDTLEITMRKSRFTRKPAFEYTIKLEDGILKPTRFN